LDRPILDGTDIECLKTFEKGEQTAFVGFGEKKPEAIDEWDYYLASERLNLKSPIYLLTQELLHTLPIEIHTKSELTRLDTDEEGVTAAVINGETVVEAKAYVISSNPVEAIKMLPQTRVDAKIRQKLSKAKMWTAMSLNLVHKGEFSAIEEPIVLTGTGETPFVVVGRFHTPRQETGKVVQFSQWMTLVFPEEGETEEVYAHSLREMKKLLQKSFPRILATVEFEKIIVSPKSHGRAPLKFQKDETFQGFNNLWFVHNSVDVYPNIPGTILRTNRVAEELLKRFDAAARDLPQASDDPSLLNL
jgi:hypothetical protein